MKHYTHDDIVGAAQPVGDGWVRTTVTLWDGDTAYLPGTTKYVVAGPGQVIYLVHPSGEEFSRSGETRVVPASR